MSSAVRSPSTAASRRSDAPVYNGVKGMWKRVACVVGVAACSSPCAQTVEWWVPVFTTSSDQQFGGDAAAVTTPDGTTFVAIRGIGVLFGDVEVAGPSLGRVSASGVVEKLEPVADVDALTGITIAGGEVIVVGHGTGGNR